MSETDVRLDQLDAWELALNQGRALLHEATELQNQAQAAEAARRWRDGAALFHQARTAYVQAMNKLETPAAIGETERRALQLLRNDAQQLLAQAQSSMRSLDSDRRAELCEQALHEAGALIQQANAALNEDNFADARVLAGQASDKDPALQDEAERIIRAADEAQGEQGGPARWAILLVLAVLLIGGAVIFGPLLWGWLRESLFPPSAVTSSLASYL